MLVFFLVREELYIFMQRFAFSIVIPKVERDSLPCIFDEILLITGLMDT